MAIRASRRLRGSGTLQQEFQAGSLVLEEAPLAVACPHQSVWILSLPSLPCFLASLRSVFCEATLSTICTGFATHNSVSVCVLPYSCGHNHPEMLTFNLVFFFFK